MNKNSLEQTKKCFLCGNESQKAEENKKHNVIYCENCGNILYTVDFFSKYIDKKTGLLLISEFESETGYLNPEENEKWKTNLIYYFKSAKSLKIEPITLEEDTIRELNEFKDVVELSIEKLLEPLATKMGGSINKLEIQKKFHEMIKTYLTKN